MFEIVPDKNYAVITGDIIDSSGLVAQERKRLPVLLHEIADTLIEWLGEEAIAPIAIYGGDSWQLLLAKPGLALRAGLFLRASLLASPLNIDTRFAIAIAGVDFVPEAGIEEADGEAFRLSGRKLTDGLRRRQAIGFTTTIDSAEAAQGDVVCHLIDALVRTNWTDNRARAVSGALRGWTGSRTGELWPDPISQQVISRHLVDAGWEAIEPALELFESFSGQKTAL